MNINIRYIIAAVTAIVALFSCAKEPVLPAEEGGTDPGEGVRIISVSFGEPTKSSLGESGFKPEFSDGDWIKLSNTTASEDCRVSVSGGKATIKTNLTGTLTAVYPREAALTDSDGLITGNGFKVPTKQSGKFSDANICMATIDASASSATFLNKTALLRFYVDGSISVKSIRITSNEPITTDEYNKKVITVDPDGEVLINTVTEGPDRRICYVSILPVENALLTFTGTTTTQGTVSRTMDAATGFEANRIYNAFIPYYIKVKVSTTPEAYQYWGYCNLGAFLPEEKGKMYSWGNLNGQKGDSFSTAFTSANYNASEGGKINNTTYLWDPEMHDAAYNELGGGWRMPTMDDFISLDNACGGAGTGQQTLNAIAASNISGGKVLTGRYWLAANQTVLQGIDGLKNIKAPGLLCSDGTNYLFFPTVGYSDSNARQNPETDGNYLSSTLYSSNTSKARYMAFKYNYVFPDNHFDRYHGFAIRAVYLPPVSSEFEKYNDGDIIL